MGRVLKIIFVLLVLGVIGLVGYGYLGDLSPTQRDVVEPVTLNGG